MKTIRHFYCLMYNNKLTIDKYCIYSNICVQYLTGSSTTTTTPPPPPLYNFQSGHHHFSGLNFLYVKIMGTVPAKVYPVLVKTIIY